MSVYGKLAEDGGLAAAGAVLCYLLLWWKGRNLKDVKNSRPKCW